MEAGDLIRDYLRGYMGLFLRMDDDDKYVKILWLDGKTGWLHPEDVQVINESR